MEDKEVARDKRSRIWRIRRWWERRGVGNGG